MSKLTGSMIALLLAAPAFALQGPPPPPGGGEGHRPPPPHEGGRRGGPPRGGGAPEGEQSAPETAGIAWFGTWEAALAEAKRTKRPILFMSAAPQCQGVPGVW